MACERVFTIKNGGVIMVSYINTRRCRNEETIETRCDKLARYNACGFRTLIRGVAAMKKPLKRAATSLRVIIAAGLAPRMIYFLIG